MKALAFSRAVVPLCLMLAAGLDFGTRAAAGSPWEIIAPGFGPPPEFAGQFGAFRSPLLFGDGAPVKSAADWPRRRAEILKQWHDLMGPWPPVLERPKLQVTSATRRANSFQP